jgi:hypothetical protein
MTFEEKVSIAMNLVVLLNAILIFAASILFDNKK